MFACYLQRYRRSTMCWDGRLPPADNTERRGQHSLVARHFCHHFLRAFWSIKQALRAGMAWAISQLIKRLDPGAAIEGTLNLLSFRLGGCGPWAPAAGGFCRCTMFAGTSTQNYGSNGQFNRRIPGLPTAWLGHVYLGWAFGDRAFRHRARTGCRHGGGRPTES